jgi:hypothetical protein
MSTQTNCTGPLLLRLLMLTILPRPAHAQASIEYRSSS